MSFIDTVACFAELSILFKLVGIVFIFGPAPSFIHTRFNDLQNGTVVSYLYFCII